VLHIQLKLRSVEELEMEIRRSARRREAGVIGATVPALGPMRAVSSAREWPDWPLSLASLIG
jgi:hypothetical protein